MNQSRVVVTGMGVAAPNGVGLTNFVTALKQGKSGIEFIPYHEKLGFGCKIGGITKIPPEIKQSWLTPETLRLLSSGIEFGCIAGLEAWKDAGLYLPEPKEDKVDWDTGIVMGNCSPGVDLNCDIVAPYTNNHNIKKLGTAMVEQTMASGISAILTGYLAAGNYTVSISSACASSADAIVLGYERILRGQAKRMLVGGTEGYSPYIWSPFDSMRVLTRNFNNFPEEGSRPLSKAASGFVPSSGAAALILENLDTALARGAKIYAEIIGANSNSGGQRGDGSITAPNGLGVAKCVQGALQQAGILSHQVNAISGHLTSTKGDVFEIRNLTQALGLKNKNFPKINALKSLIGHTLGAAGVMGLVATISQIHEGFLHPSLNTEEVHDDILALIDEDCIVKESVKMDDLKIMASMSFGFGDVNCCIITKKYER